MFAHGGLFTTKGVAQGFWPPQSTRPSRSATASEGGAWGIAVLAAFLADRAPGQSLADYLDDRCSPTPHWRRPSPNPADVAGFDAFMQRYIAALPVERARSSTPESASFRVRGLNLNLSLSNGAIAAP